MVGAAVLTWLPVFLKAQVPQQDRQMWIGALVLAMMIFRPAGLIPAKRRAAELEGFDAPGLVRGLGRSAVRGAVDMATPIATEQTPAGHAAGGDLVFDIQHVTLRFGGVV